jgi:hypothetical protein
MQRDELSLIPPVPERLREAAQLGMVIPFIGAGVSRLAGCPDWRGFADRALQFFVDKGKLSYGQLAQMRSLGPRVKLSLALHLQEELELKIDFRCILHQAPRSQHAMGRRIYSLLGSLFRTFVTTNYDEWLDDELLDAPSSVDPNRPAIAEPIERPRQVFFTPESLTAANLNMPGAVLHLHGSVKKPSEMVITTRQYVNHYRNDRRNGPENPVLTFLTHLFANKNVLFVGYSLEELEILEYVILKAAAAAPPGMTPRHFILQGFFSHERELIDAMAGYYRDCGIGLLPFLRDERDWEQLVFVLDDYARAMPASNLSLLQELQEMEGMLDD